MNQSSTMFTNQMMIVAHTYVQKPWTLKPDTIACVSQSIPIEPERRNPERDDRQRKGQQPGERLEERVEDPKNGRSQHDVAEVVNLTLVRIAAVTASTIAFTIHERNKRWVKVIVAPPVVG